MPIPSSSQDASTMPGGSSLHRRTWRRPVLRCFGTLADGTAGTDLIGADAIGNLS
jgi:hypothetical protein